MKVKIDASEANIDLDYNPEIEKAKISFDDVEIIMDEEELKYLGQLIKEYFE